MGGGREKASEKRAHHQSIVVAEQTVPWASAIGEFSEHINIEAQKWQVDLPARSTQLLTPPTAAPRGSEDHIHPHTASHAFSHPLLLLPLPLNRPKPPFRPPFAPLSPPIRSPFAPSEHMDT